MIDKNIDTIYKFKTYNKSFVATNEKVNALSSNGDGFVAYIPNKYSNKDLSFIFLLNALAILTV